MRCIRLRDADSEKVLSFAERVLRAGGIVVVPTDTVYGIIGDATKAEVIEKIFKMKGRFRGKALPIFVKDVATARKYAYVSDAKAKFLEKIWPGPVTIIFHRKEKLPALLTGRLSTMGIRIPNHSFLVELLSRLDVTLAETSANVSGGAPAENCDEIKKYFAQGKVRPNLIIDGGEISGKPSTVVDFTGKEPTVVRTGMVSRAELDVLLGSLL